jgi:hypothetical protein
MNQNILILIIIVVVFAALILIRRSKDSLVAERGTYEKLPELLKKLKNGENEFGTVGFLTEDQTTLYFVYENGEFFLDYELNTAEKKPHEASFRKVAGEHELQVTDTSYGDFPVLRVNAGNSAEKATKLGFGFSKKMFGYSNETEFMFVP